MKREIRPMPGQVLIIPEENNPETFLHIPDAWKNRDMPKIGMVLAIGNRRAQKDGTPIDYEFKQGDRVLFRKFTGLWVQVGSRKLIKVDARDIEAVLG